MPSVALPLTIAAKAASRLTHHERRWRNIGVQRAVQEEREHIVADTAARIFADLADPQIINKAADGAWKEPLWRALSDVGLPLAWVPEELGGSGAGLADGFAILGVAGRFALSVPLAETLAAGWLLAHAGLEAPKTPMTLAPARPHDRITIEADGRLNGCATGVPFARDCRTSRCLLTTGEQQMIVLVDIKDCRRQRRPQSRRRRRSMLSRSIASSHSSAHQRRTALINHL